MDPKSLTSQMPVLRSEETKTWRILLIAGACSLLALVVYRNFPLPSTIAGRYVNVNYQNSVIFPNVPDVLVLMTDGTFMSQVAGKGTFRVWLTPFGTKIQLDYDGLHSDLQTDMRKTLDGSTRIILLEDVEHAYVKP